MEEHSKQQCPRSKHCVTCHHQPWYVCVARFLLRLTWNLIIARRRRPQCDLSYLWRSPRGQRWLRPGVTQTRPLQGLRGHVTVVGRQKEMRIHRLDFVPCRQVKLALWLTGCLSCLGQVIQTTVRNWKKSFFYSTIFCNAFEWDWFKLLQSSNSCFNLLCIMQNPL